MSKATVPHAPRGDVALQQEDFQLLPIEGADKLVGTAGWCWIPTYLCGREELPEEWRRDVWDKTLEHVDGGGINPWWAREANQA